MAKLNRLVDLNLHSASYIWCRLVANYDTLELILTAKVSLFEPHPDLVMPDDTLQNTVAESLRSEVLEFEPDPISWALLEGIAPGQAFLVKISIPTVWCGSTFDPEYDYEQIAEVVAVEVWPTAAIIKSWERVLQKFEAFRALRDEEYSALKRLRMSDFTAMRIVFRDVYSTYEHRVLAQLVTQHTRTPSGFLLNSVLFETQYCCSKKAARENLMEKIYGSKHQATWRHFKLLEIEAELREEDSDSVFY